jgi:hypothetical protein
MSTLPNAPNTHHEPNLRPVVAITAQDTSTLEVMRALEEAKTITRQVFAGQFACVEQEDFEIVGDRYFLFRVFDNGEIGDVLARDSEWHRRIAGLSPEMIGLFRLSIETAE